MMIPRIQNDSDKTDLNLGCYFEALREAVHLVQKHIGEHVRLPDTVHVVSPEKMNLSPTTKGAVSFVGASMTCWVRDTPDEWLVGTLVHELAHVHELLGRKARFTPRIHRCCPKRRRVTDHNICADVLTEYYAESVTARSSVVRDLEQITSLFEALPSLRGRPEFERWDQVEGIAYGLCYSSAHVLAHLTQGTPLPEDVRFVTLLEALIGSPLPKLPDNSIGIETTSWCPESFEIWHDVYERLVDALWAYTE